jgi:hypothetical protein
VPYYFFRWLRIFPVAEKVLHNPHHIALVEKKLNKFRWSFLWLRSLNFQEKNWGEKIFFGSDFLFAKSFGGVYLNVTSW